MLFLELPFDILPHILGQLCDSKDWNSCTLVSRVFNRVATPLLYRTLHPRICLRLAPADGMISQTQPIVHHPSTTLLKRPELALYVRHVTEFDSVHRNNYENLTENALRALSLCKHLQSFSWIDQSSTADSSLLALLAVVRVHPLREICIKTHRNISDQVWAKLITFSGICRISIWCMEGPPRVLQGWAESLSTTLTHLELGRCSGVPSTILISVLSQLPRLEDLCLKGAHANAIPTILTYLVNLQSLDTEFLGTYRSRFGIASYEASSRSSFPILRSLTVRARSIDSSGLQKLWGWIGDLLPLPGLETFNLYAFTVNTGYTSIPRIFILDFVHVHGPTLKHFMVGDAHLTLSDIECICSLIPNLETVTCSVAISDIKSVIDVVTPAKKLRTLKVNVHWVTRDKVQDVFSERDVMDMMLRSKDSQLRVIAIGPTQYTVRFLAFPFSKNINDPFQGRWVLDDADGCDGNRVKFHVVSDFAKD